MIIAVIITAAYGVFVWAMCRAAAKGDRCPR
jgi:hypothetical protein